MTFMVLVLTLLVSCDFRVARDPDVLVFSFRADPPVLNPVLGEDSSAFMVNQYIFDSLMGQNPDTLLPIPRLAARLLISPDHLSYTYYLRGGVKWHDGEPFGIDDVIYTFEKISDPKVDSPLKAYLSELKSIEKVPGNAVKFTFKKAHFRTVYFLNGLKIIPKHIFDNGNDLMSHAANRAPIGTGPFKFVEWKNGRSITLTRFENYWGEKPAIQGIVYKIIPDSTVNFQLLKKGAIDLAHLQPIQWAKETLDKPFGEKFTKHRYYTPNASFIAWNTRMPMFSDRRVRIAMTMLVDRQKILDKILFGEGLVVPTEFYPFGPDADKTIKPYPYDPKEAARLLDEAGWKDRDGDGIRDKDGVPFKFSLLFASGDRISKSLAILMREDLSRAGIVMNDLQLEWATMLGKIRQRDFDAAATGWANPFKYDPYHTWHSSQAEKGMNLSGFSDRDADRILKEAQLEFDAEKRSELFKKLQAIIHREEPSTFLFTAPVLIVVAKRFEDVVVHKSGVFITEWKIGPGPELLEW